MQSIDEGVDGGAIIIYCSRFLGGGDDKIMQVDDWIVGLDVELCTFDGKEYRGSWYATTMEAKKVTVWVCM